MTCKMPVLIVYALVNRQYMLDIQPDRSIVRNLLQHGMDLYIIDWGYPTKSDMYLTLDDYISGYLDNCVRCYPEENRTGQDQPDGHMPGRDLLRDLFGALSGEGEESRYPGGAL